MDGETVLDNWQAQRIFEVKKKTTDFTDLNDSQL